MAVQDPSYPVIHIYLFISCFGIHLFFNMPNMVVLVLFQLSHLIDLLAGRLTDFSSFISWISELYIDWLVY